MTAMVDRTLELLEQLPIRGYEAEGSESLPLTRTLVENAVSAIQREPNRMGAWRLVGAALEARKAFKTHIALCHSAYGPLMRLASERADMDHAARRLLDEHAGLVACLDDLISMANRDKASTPAAARALKETALGCAEAFDAYERRYRALVFSAPLPAKRIAS